MNPVASSALHAAAAASFALLLLLVLASGRLLACADSAVPPAVHRAPVQHATWSARRI